MLYSVYILNEGFKNILAQDAVSVNTLFWWTSIYNKNNNIKNSTLSIRMILIPFDISSFN